MYDGYTDEVLRTMRDELLRQVAKKNGEVYDISAELARRAHDRQRKLFEQ